MEQTPTASASASGLFYEPNHPFWSHEAMQAAATEETATVPGILNESHQFQELLNGSSHSLPDSALWDSKIEAASMDPMFLASHNLGQSYHQPGISCGVVPSQIGNVSTPLASQNLGQSHNQLGSSLFKSDPGSDDPAKIKKRATDKAYRERCKGKMIQNKSLKEENDSLKKMNKSLEANTSSMYKMLKDQDKKFEQLSNDLHQVKREHEKQNFLVQTLSRLLADADPMRLEIEKLKDEIASLRKNATPDSSRLAEENAKLRIENKALKVQNDALCEVAIRNDNEHKQEHQANMCSSS